MVALPNHVAVDEVDYSLCEENFLEYPAAGLDGTVLELEFNGAVGLSAKK